MQLSKLIFEMGSIFKGEVKMSLTNRPKSMLVKNAAILVTMDKERREIKDGGMYIEDGEIKLVDRSDKLPQSAELILDMKGRLVLPGLINTHHHLYQHLTRVVPKAQNGNVWNWLKVLYPIWARITPDAMRLSTQVGIAEQVLSGCTRSSIMVTFSQTDVNSMIRLKLRKKWAFAFMRRAAACRADNQRRSASG